MEKCLEGEGFGQVYLVDTGMSGQLLLPFLQSKGLRQIDKVFITHPHKDHYGGCVGAR